MARCVQLHLVPGGSIQAPGPRMSAQGHEVGSEFAVVDDGTETAKARGRRAIRARAWTIGIDGGGKRRFRTDDNIENCRGEGNGNEPEDICAQGSEVIRFTITGEAFSSL